MFSGRVQRFISALLVPIFLFTFLFTKGEIVDSAVLVGDVNRPSVQIYHIHDLHAQPSAQFDIARIVETVFSDQLPVTGHKEFINNGEHRTDNGLLVLVEGAAGPVNTKLFGAFPDPAIRRLVFAKFVKMGWVSGVEYLAISKNETIPLNIQGIDDPKLYVEHLRTFQSVIETKEEAYEWLETREESLNQNIEIYFNDELFSLYRLDRSLENGKISLVNFVERLIKTAEKKKIRLKDFRMLTRYYALTQGEKNILKQPQSKKELRELIRKRVRLLRKYEKLNIEDLMSEIKILKKKLYDLLTLTKREKDLRTIVEEHHLLKHILKLQATSQEWRHWNRIKPALSIKGAEDFLKEASHFYELALKRDKALYQNTVRVLSKYPVSQRIILITGGFHAQGIDKRLRKQGARVQTVIPHSGGTLQQDHYFTVMKAMGSRYALAVCSPFSVLMDFVSPGLRRAIHARMILSLAGHYVSKFSLRNLQWRNLMSSLARPIVVLSLLVLTLLPNFAIGEESEKPEDKNFYARFSGLLSTDDINASQFVFGEARGDHRFQWRVGSSRIITNLLNSGDFQFYKESVPRLGLFSLYTGDVQSAQAHLHMPQYVFYTDIDGSLGEDVDLVLGIQAFMLPLRTGDEYRLGLGHVSPYGGLRWRMFHWDTHWGPVGFLGDMGGKFFYQRTPPERFYDPTAFDRSEITLDTRFEYELERNLDLRLPFQLYANLQPWMEYLWQSIEWDRPDPTYDEAYRVIEEQVTRGYGFYGKLNFGSLEDAIVSGEKGLAPNPSAKVKLRGPTILGLKLGPELDFRKGSFRSRAGLGVGFFWVPQLTISAAYKDDFKPALQRVFTPWDFQASPFTYLGTSYDFDNNRVGLELAIHGPKFLGNDEFDLDLPIPWSLRAFYERQGLIYDSWGLEAFVRYRNYTDPFGYVIIPDSRFEGGLILRFGKEPERRRITDLTKIERVRLRGKELKEDEEGLEEERRDLQEQERRLEEERKELKKREKGLQGETPQKKDFVPQGSFFFGLGGLLSLRGAERRSNLIPRSIWRWILGLVLLVLPACGFLSSFPVDRLENVTVTEQEDDVYELFTPWDFIEPDGEYEQSPHTDLVRDSNNAYRLEEGQTLKLKFKSDFKQSVLAKLYVFLDFMSYYSNGIPHEFTIWDADGVSYRFNVDVSGGEDKEYKIDVEKLIHAILYNGLNLDRLQAIEIRPLGSGRLDINFSRNLIVLLNNKHGAIRDLENLPRHLFDGTAISSMGMVDLSVPNPRRGEDTIHAVWQGPHDVAGLKAVTTSTMPMGVYPFGDQLSLNIASTRPILYLELKDLLGNTQNLLLGNAKPEGGLLWLSQDKVKARVQGQNNPVNLNLVTSIALYAQKNKEGEGFVSVQGLFDDDAGELAGVPFTDAVGQDVTILPDDGSWDVASGQERLSLDPRYVDNGRQGALELFSGGLGVGFVARDALPFGDQDRLRYVVTGIDHVLTFVVQDGTGQEIRNNWNIQVPADVNRGPVFLSIPFADVLKDLQEEGYEVSGPLRIKSVHWRPGIGGLGLLEYLTLNAIKPLWVSIPTPIRANSAADYLNVTGAGPLDAFRLKQYYFVGRNPTDLERNYFRYEGLPGLPVAGIQTGLWMGVSSDFLEGRKLRLQLTSTQPLLTLEVKDEVGNKVHCHLLGPSPEPQQFSVLWDPAFARMLSPELGLGIRHTVSVYVDAEELTRQMNAPGPFSGEVSFKGLISRAQAPRTRYTITHPRPLSPMELPDYLEVDSTGQVFYDNISNAYFEGVDVFLESGFSFSSIYPSWLRVEDNRAGIYFGLAPTSQDFTGRRTFTVQAKGVMAHKGVIVFKDANGQEAHYELDGLTPNFQTYILDLTRLERLNPAIDRTHITTILYLVDADLLWNGQDETYQGSLGLKGVKRSQFGSLRREIKKDKVQFAAAA